MSRIFYSLVIILFISCSKDNCGDGFKNKFTPIFYETYFELLKSDGSSYNNQEVRISYELKKHNGVIIPPNTSEWYDLYEINYLDSISNIKIFGLGCENCEFTQGVTYGGGPGECGYGLFENWILERYYFLEFPNQEIDTLLIKDILEPGSNRSYEFYINSVEIEMQNALNYPYLQIIH